MCAYLNDLKPQAARILLGSGIIAAVKRQSQYEVKHLQLNYFNKLDYHLRI